MDILESSRNYRELTLEEARSFAVDHPCGWLDPDMPGRQYTTVVYKELEQFRAGGAVVPYDVLVTLLRAAALHSDATLLDVGASSGYYSQVLTARGIPYHYTGLDYSQHYADFARRTFGVEFIVANAVDMPVVADRSYDIVLTGGMLMHTLDYEQAIREIQRVADKQIVFHRTPVATHDQTRYFVKEAYGLPCLEVHFNEGEILELFENNDWDVMSSATVGWDDEAEKGYVSYLCRRIG